MSMQEQQHQIKIYDFFQKMVYGVVTLDCLILFFQKAEIPVLSNILQSFGKMGVFYPPINAKFATLVLISLFECLSVRIYITFFCRCDHYANGSR